MSNCGSAKRDSPSAQRNKGPILDFLSKKAFPSFLDNEMTLILEIAAGCGVHTDHFARMLAKEDTLQPFKWLPTDPEEAARASIQSYIEESELTEFVKSPLRLTLNEYGIVEDNTASMLDYPLDLVICINMIHISPWQATLGLMKVAGEKLCEEGYLYCCLLYTSPSPRDGLLSRMPSSA